ncbi:MAG: hypothetical protein IKQ91_07515 [Oscillospiraceae bacterium]|nr:hypothetical protein [Oscillospiraceae bacterium]
MALSQYMQAKYEENRLRMNKLNGNFSKYMWFMIILGAIIFLSAFIAGIMSTMAERDKGVGLFYYAMSAGILQILLSAATILLGWITAAKKRIASFILLGIYLIAMIAILVQKNGTFAAANIIFLLTGIGLNIWAQMLFNEDNLLKGEPGYPLFSPEAAERAHYEVPLNVRIRQAEAGKAMATIGGTAAEPQPEIPQPEAVLPAQEYERDDEGFSNPKPLGPTPSVHRPETLHLSGPVNLEEMRTPYGESPQPAEPAEPVQPAPLPQIQLDALTNVQKTEEPVPQQLNAADLLVDMTAIPSHATAQGNPDLLPTPEDVRARLAAMKRARQEHPSDR